MSDRNMTKNINDTDDGRKKRLLLSAICARQHGVPGCMEEPLKKVKIMDISRNRTMGQECQVWLSKLQQEETRILDACSKMLITNDDQMFTYGYTSISSGLRQQMETQLTKIKQLTRAVKDHRLAAAWADASLNDVLGAPHQSVHDSLRHQCRHISGTNRRLLEDHTRCCTAAEVPKISRIAGSL